MPSMRVQTPSAGPPLSATLPARTRVLPTPEAQAPAPVPDLAAAVRAALAAPRGLGRLRDLVRPGAAVTIAFDDATVASYGPIRGVAIEAVLAELAEAGVPRGRVTLVCAHALHRKLRPAGLARPPR